MKPILVSSIAALVLALPSLATAQESAPVIPAEPSRFDLRFLVGAGHTFVGNDVALAYGDDLADGMDRITVNGTLASQVLVGVTDRLKLGAELGFSHWLNEQSDQLNHPLAAAQEDGYCLHGIHMSGIMELKLTEILRLQAGMGMYATLLLDDKFGSVYGGSASYFFFAPGAEIPVSESISIPLSLRISTLELVPANYGSGTGPGSIIPVTFLGGVNLKL